MLQKKILGFSSQKFNKKMSKICFFCWLEIPPPSLANFKYPFKISRDVYPKFYPPVPGPQSGLEDEDNPVMSFDKRFRVELFGGQKISGIDVKNEVVTRDMKGRTKKKHSRIWKVRYHASAYPLFSNFEIMIANSEFLPNRNSIFATKLHLLLGVLLEFSEWFLSPPHPQVVFVEAFP